MICTARCPFLLVALLLCSAGDVLSQEPEQAKTGIFTAEFTEKHPLSDPERMTAVMKPRPGQKLTAYDPADHTFQLVVPEDYDGSEAYGVLVFIHSKNDVSIEQWFYGKVVQEVLAKHKLIWVSYDKAGNPEMPNIRMGLALDAVHNVQQRYNIDKRRVYVSGVSGGGRMTCMTGVYYPEVFTGGIPIIGTLYFRQATLPDDPELRALIRPEPPAEGGVWGQNLLKPRARQLREMIKSQRWVLLAGEKDYNMPQMRAHFEQGFEKDGFEHAHYLEVPGMAHDYPPREWFEKAIVLLDKPLSEKRAANLPPADERTQRLARKRLEVALRTLERNKERGVRALELLVEDLPNTEAAVEASAKLQALSQE